MAKKQNIDRLLNEWAYEPESLTVRKIKGDDGREVIQMRIEMGLLQLETTGRPDGQNPEGFETYYDLLNEAATDDEFLLTPEHCVEIDREFVQFYHRRICWLAMREFDYAVKDADHTLGLMDFCRSYSDDDNWTMTHEQYRPFVLFHRTQAESLKYLEGSEPESAVQTINDGLQRINSFFEEFEMGEQFTDSELVERLVEFRESLREKFEVGRTLAEKLQDAIETEQYELAAKIRDQLANRDHGAR